jgi:hypothetical protein
MIVYEGRRPGIPPETPQGLQELVVSCWDRDPQNRPSFDAIFEAFRSHRAYFLNADDRAIEEVLEKMYTVDPELKTVSMNVDLPEELKGDNSDNPFAVGDPIVIPALNSPTFVHDLQSVSKNVTKDNVDQFFEGLKPLLSSTENSELVAVFQALTNVFTDREHVTLFIERNLHLEIPITRESASPELGVVLLHLFSYHPECISEEMISGISEIALTIPSETLTFFNLYITYEKVLPHKEYVYTTILKHGESYIHLGLSYHLVKHLRNYQLTDPDFFQTHKDSVNAIFREALQIGYDPAQEFLLKLVINNPEFVIILSESVISRRLMDRTLFKFALEICAKYPIPFDTNLINALLFNSQTSEIASRTLIVRCNVDEDIAIFTANLASIWINAQLPTLKETLELINTIIQFQTCREILVSCRNFSMLFIAIADSGNAEFMSAIVRITRQLPLTPDFVANCERCKFLEQYYRLALENKEALWWVEVISLTDILARVAFNNQYLLLVPALRQMIEKPGWWCGRAISLLAILSTHPETHESLGDPVLVNTIKQFGTDERLAPYVRCFMRCVGEVKEE